MEVVHGYSAQEDQEDVVYESILEGDCPDKGFQGSFYVATYEEIAIWWGNLGSHGCANKLEKMPTHK